MSMGMGMHFSFDQRLEQRQLQICTICKRPMTNDEGHNGHASLCPHFIIAATLRSPKNVRYRCPDCHKAEALGINHSDFYECRACHTQFSASLLVPGVDEPQNEKQVVVLTPNDDAIFVVRMPEKGVDNFPLDKTIEYLDRVRTIAQNRSKRKRKPIDLYALWAEQREIWRQENEPSDPKLLEKMTDILKSAAEI